MKLVELLSPDAIAALPERDRRLLIVCAVGLVLVVLFGVLVPFDRHVSHAKQLLERKQTDLAWMKGVAPELALTAPPPASTGESLLVIVDRSAREAGLASSLAGSEPGAQGTLSVRLEKAPFDVLVGWLARLAAQNGVSVDSASIEKAGAPGLVNAAIFLHSG
jgi:general secretion pathway protein M